MTSPTPRAAALLAVWVSVLVVVVGLVPNVADTPVGRAALRVTGPVKFPYGITVSVVVTEPPSGML